MLHSKARLIVQDAEATQTDLQMAIRNLKDGD